MKLSAGLVVYRFKGSQLEVMLAHMGAPWWAKKDVGAWTIPKGEYNDPEDPKAAARREFKEELGLDAPDGEWLDLGAIEQKNNKSVAAWAVKGDVDSSQTRSNTFKMEWPPKSGKFQEFPEIDRTAWFTPEEAIKRIVPGQDELVRRLAEKLGAELGAGKSSESEQQSLL